MGGAPVYVEADGIFVGKADFAQRHQDRWPYFGDGLGWKNMCISVDIYAIDRFL